MGILDAPVVASVDHRLATGFGRALARIEPGQTLKVGWIGDSGLEGTTVDATVDVNGVSRPVGRLGFDDTASRVVAELSARFGVPVASYNRAVSGHTTASALWTAVSSPGDPTLLRRVTDATITPAGVLSSPSLAATSADVGKSTYVHIPGRLSYRTTVATVDSATQVTLNAAPAGLAQTLVGTTATIHASANTNATPFAKALGDACHLYVIAYGHNDTSGGMASGAVRGLPLAASMRYLEYMVRRLRVELDAEVMVSTSWPYVGSGAAANNTNLALWNTAARQLAARLGVEFADSYGALVALGVPGYEARTDATNHLNSDGHATWAADILRHFPRRQPIVAPVRPLLPTTADYASWRLDTRGLVSLTTVAAGNGTDRVRLTGTWSNASAAPSTSSTAGDQIVVLWAGSDALLRLDTGPGQGVVNIDVDGFRSASNLNLGTASSSSSQSVIPLQAAIGAAGLPGPGVHVVIVTLVSGSVTWRGVAYAPGVVEWWDVGSPRMTFSAGWGARATNSAAWNGAFRSVLGNGETISYDFVGTAAGLNMLRYNNPAQTVTVTLDGVSLGNVQVGGDQQGGAAGLSAFGNWVAVSGQPYGRHTLLLTGNATTGTWQVYAGWSADESRLMRPCIQRGVVGAADVVKFPSPFGGRPLVRMFRDTASGDLTASGPASTGFTASGTTGLAVWDAEGTRVVY